MSNISSSLEKAMQGVLSWMGYRKSLYNGYEIRELPLADLFCCILQGSLHDGERVESEVAYKELMRAQAKECQEYTNKFADVVIWDGKKELDTVIEIKRYGSKWSEIYEDVKRLSILKRDCPNKNIYELIISDGKVPKEFVDPCTGRAVSGKVYFSPKKCKSKKGSIGAIECGVVRVCSLAQNKLSVEGLKNDPLKAAEKLFSKASFACLLKV